MRTPVHPRYVPPPYQDAPESGRLLLRDGTIAQIRLARPDDRDAMRAFFERLSPDSRRRRFFAMATPRPELVASLCDNSNPRATLTLVVTRTIEDEPTAMEGVIVPPMVSGVEVMVGVTQDPLFGPWWRSAWAASTSRSWRTCASA